MRSFVNRPAGSKSKQTFVSVKKIGFQSEIGSDLLGKTLGKLNTFLDSEDDLGLSIDEDVLEIGSKEEPQIDNRKFYISIKDFILGSAIQDVIIIPSKSNHPILIKLAYRQGNNERSQDFCRSIHPDDCSQEKDRW